MKIDLTFLSRFWHAVRLIAVLGLFIGCASLGMAQRSKGKSPSPADHGMMLPQDAPGKKGPSRRGPMRAELPQDNKQPTNDYPHPSDPNSGVGPEENNEGDIPTEARDVVEDNDDQMGEVLSQSPLLPPKITKWEIYKIAPFSDFGSPGDWMLVLTGLNFLEAESQPILHLGDKIALDEVHVGEKGTELFAVLPKELGPQIVREGFGRMCLQNPGGMNRDPKGWVWLPVEPLEFAKALQEAVEGKLKRGPFFLQLQK